MKLRSIAAGLVTVMAVFTVATQTVFARGYYYTSSDFGAGEGIAFFLIMCCFILLSFGVNIFLSWYVYNDAKKNGIDSAFLWAVVTFFFTLIGLLIYLLAIRPDAIRAQEAKNAAKTTEPEKK